MAACTILSIRQGQVLYLVVVFVLVKLGLWWRFFLEFVLCFGKDRCGICRAQQAKGSPCSMGSAASAGSGLGASVETAGALTGMPGVNASCRSMAGEPVVGCARWLPCCELATARDARSQGIGTPTEASFGGLQLVFLPDHVCMQGEFS